MDGSTTPTTSGGHGAGPSRGVDSTPSSPSFNGRYGRLFRNLPVYDVADASLVALGQAMIQGLEEGQLDKPLGEADEDENTSTLENGTLRLPAGYTYFGQFVDHDITFDPVSSLARQNDPDALIDFRTPRFDLDSLYGRGPADQPYLYEDGHHLAKGELRSEQTPPANEAVAGPDLPRAATGRAIIGDPRNDENLIVSQLQSAFIRFHNAVVDIVGNNNAGLTPDDVFKLAQKTVRWHYQWVVVHDFLPRLVGSEVLDDVLPLESFVTPEGETVSVRAPRLRFYKWRHAPYMPLEFSVAAYRYGHSMVRPSYLINDVAIASPPVEGANRIPLFSQTGAEKQSLNGFRPLPTDWGVQWKFFLAGIHGGEGATNLPQPSYNIDAELSHPLGALPDATAGPELVAAGFDPSIAQDLAVRNLLRGKRLDLPSGQDVARAMGIAPLSDDELFGDVAIDDSAKADLAGCAPLWFYVLKEAKVRSASSHLGPVGGRIVAETLIGLLAGDPLSYLNVEPNWTPTLDAATQGSFTLSDLINVAIPAPGVAPPPPYNP